MDELDARAGEAKARAMLSSRSSPEESKAMLVSEGQGEDALGWARAC
jgi:hypothetical protein